LKIATAETRGNNEVIAKELLADRLINEGLITQEQLGQALVEEQGSADLLGRQLVKLGYIDDHELTKVYQLMEDEKNNRLLDIEQYSSQAEDIDISLLSMIPESLIRKYKFFPVKKRGNNLYIAMADVFNVMALDDLRLLTGFDIHPLQTTEKDVSAFIDRHFGMPEVEKAILDIVGEMDTEEAEEVVDADMVDDAPVIKLVNSIILKAITEDASDIHIEPTERGIQVRFRVDGILHQAMNLPRKMTFSVISRIKVMSNLDIADRRTPQDGRIPLKIADRNMDLRVSTLPTIYGEKVVIRILDKENIKNYTLDKLGFSKYNMEQFMSFLKSSYGMILVSGPTGSGKTTTLYTALKVLNNADTNIITVEDPVEYVLDGINQAQVHAKIGATFATYLRSILRQDPDVIMVGEIRDQETAEIAIRSATTGHLVLSTLHTNDAPGVITRLIDMGIEPFMVASSVTGVVSQRLVRRICPDCRVKYTPTMAEMTFAGMDDPNLDLFEGRGCDKCNNSGYRGRVAIHELLNVTPTIQRLILKSPSNDELRHMALREGMVSLKDDGIYKVQQGVTTIKEVMRVAFREEEA
jgi:type IV pilus assembly protein PilB